MKHRPPLSLALSRMRTILIYVNLTATSHMAIAPASLIAFLLSCHLRDSPMPPE